MTDTLHRVVAEVDLGKEFIVFCALAKGHNEKGWGLKAKLFAEIALKYDPLNIGDIAQFIHKGTRGKVKEIIENVSDGSDEVKVVLNNINAVKALLKELRNASLGISICVTGDEDILQNALKDIGIQAHSIEHSLGVRGRIEKLPPRTIMELSTMCGHGMVTFNGVKTIMDRVKMGKMTTKEAAEYLSIPCVCGIFNPERAQRILEMARLEG